MRRLDIGVVSYSKTQKLHRTLTSIREQSRTDWRCFIIDNPGRDPDARPLISRVAEEDKRFVPVFMPDNVGYAGGVNKLFALAETDLIAHCDDDIEILTPGWDETFALLLDANPECGWVFPGPGHYGFHNGRYRECLWNAGYCWMLRRSAMLQVAKERPAAKDTGMDTTLGHHEEVDLMIRLRLAGWRVGCDPEVNVLHHETATNANSADHKPGGRIHDGVVRWMNKHNRYFCGDDLEYSMTAYDPRALRYTDWNVCALYLERMTLHYFPDWNSNPRTVMVPGVGEMDVVEVLKPKGPYKGRAI